MQLVLRRSNGVSMRRSLLEYFSTYNDSRSVSRSGLRALAQVPRRVNNIRPTVTVVGLTVGHVVGHLVGVTVVVRTEVICQNQQNFC
jgi:hypothetical protein